MIRKTLLQYLRISHSVFLFNLFRLHNSSAKFFRKILLAHFSTSSILTNDSRKILLQEFSRKILL